MNNNTRTHTAYLRDLCGDTYSACAEWAQLEDTFGGAERAEFSEFVERHYANERAYAASILQDNILYFMDAERVDLPF